MPFAPKQFRPAGQPSTAKDHSRQQRRSKGTTAERGYGARWQKFRKWYFCFPANVLCGCGCNQAAEELDHVERVSGPDDPKFFDPANLLGMAIGCHTRKTNLVDRGFGNAPSAEGRALLVRLKAEAARRAKLMEEGIGYA